MQSSRTVQRADAEGDPASCDVLINISVARLPHLCDGNDNSTYLVGLLWGLIKIMHIKSLGLYIAQGKVSVRLLWEC